MSGMSVMPGICGMPRLSEMLEMPGMFRIAEITGVGRTLGMPG